MAQQMIRFQDDLWYVRRVVALVADAAKIQPDAGFFADHIAEEVRFAGDAVRRLRELLESSPRLMDRADHLALLSRSSRALADAASDLASGDGDLCRALAGRREELSAAAAELRSISSELRDMAGAARNEGPADGDIVSGDELSELLRGGNP